MEQQQGVMFSLTLIQALYVACLHQRVLLCLCLLFPLLASGSLLCNSCSLHRVWQTCKSTTTECGPNKLCFSGRGFFGEYHVVSEQGCVARALCGSVQTITLKGVNLSMNYTCCCRDQCNLLPEPEKALKILMGVALNPNEATVTTNMTMDDCLEKDPSEQGSIKQH